MVFTNGILWNMNSDFSFADMLNQKMSDDEIESYLIQLTEKGETVEHVVSLVMALRARMVTVSTTMPLLDCCGTGGDGSHSLNVSTAVSFVVAGAGIRVAKHGNRAASSQSGAGDVLEALGINISAHADKQKEALGKFGFCFLMAPLYHPALKPIASIRKKIPHKTIFNLTGPLLNPAGADHQLIGVYSQDWIFSYAQILKSLGKTKRAMIVSSDDGLDEISLSAPTRYALLNEDGEIKEGVLTPADFGLPSVSLSELKGGNAAYNATLLMQALRGDDSAYRAVILANAAACLWIAGVSKTLKDGVDRAAQSLDDGKALAILESYREFVKE
jgi:anthranilate phosphoribosyltransferase